MTMHTILTAEETTILEKMSKKLLQDKGIRFAGVLNDKGKIVGGGFGPSVTPFDEARLQMLFMEIALDISMRREFDDTLGKIESLISKREKVNMITIPFEKLFLLVSADKTQDLNNLEKKMIEAINELKSIKS